ncbi:hypothetical protein [Candidatus Phyllobacterium onerii]|uniref:hypothetical protein n=1 Tax=Candidatus Phyllobacterium onerii TaxID=3020828 RepID=UPI00232EDE48|nr:hypothetical protein [Phyllobacterium sp. IY22]
MLQVTVAAGILPPDCQSDTALDVIYGPHVNSAMMCEMQGQSFVARGIILGRSPDDT